MSCQKEKDRGKSANGRNKKRKGKKMELGIHLVKTDHGATKGRETLTMLPQIIPISLAEAFIQPLDKKVKTKRKMRTMVFDIHKPTIRMDNQVNTEKFPLMTSMPRICHKALHRDRLSILDAHNPLSFSL